MLGRREECEIYGISWQWGFYMPMYAYDMLSLAQAMEGK